MSAYKDLIKELPKRILSLIENYYSFELKQNDSKETTLLISFAMPIFCISGEQLKKNNKYSNLKESIKNKVRDSKWFSHNLSNNILVGKTKMPEMCYGGDCLVNHNHKTINNILSIFRNALAHGNIQFEPHENSDQIKNIIFCSYISERNHEEGYLFCKISTCDFKQLLINVCNFMINSKIDSVDLAYILNTQNAA